MPSSRMSACPPPLVLRKLTSIASNVCWLLYDMSWMFERQLGEATLRSVEEFWRAAACAGSSW